MQKLANRNQNTLTIKVVYRSSNKQSCKIFCQIQPTLLHKKRRQTM